MSALVLGCVCGTASTSENAEPYRKDPNTPIEFKAAIRQGVVVLGMCPFQAFAAAGFPGLYMVKPDPEVWGHDVPPPEIIDAQCDRPDKSVIEVKFRNKT